MKRFILLVLLLALMAGCGKGSDPTRVSDDLIPVTSIRIVAVTSKIAASTSTRLTVVGDHSGVFTSDITSQSQLECSNTAIADFITLGQANRLSGLQPGDVTLTARFGNLTATLPMTISTATITAVNVSPAAASVAKGLTVQLTASGTFSDGTTQDITFDVIWTDDGTGTATVSNDIASKGVATGVIANGTALITADFTDVNNTTMFGAATLNITAAILQSLTVTPANSSVAGFKKTVNFIATGTYSDNSTVDVSNQVTWSSSQQAVATIAAGGAATTVAAGTTSITAALSGVTGQTNLTVLNLSSLQINPTGLNLTVGTNQRFTLTATFADNSTLDVTSTSEWNSTTTTVATVGNTASDKGLVSAVTVGTSVVTASYGGLTISAPITVQ